MNTTMSFRGSRAVVLGLTAGLFAPASACVARPDRTAAPADATPAPVPDDAGEKLMDPRLDAMTRVTLLRAVARQLTPPTALEPALSAVLEMPVDAETLSQALRALGGYHTKSAVGAVLRFAVRSLPIRGHPELGELVLDTLERQTGRAEPARSVRAWREWWDRAESWDEAHWTQEIGAALAERARSAEERRRAAQARLAEAYRRLLVALPEAQRSPLIAELIASEFDELRELGFDQATRAVLNGQALGAEASMSAMARLRDADPRSRAASAALLEKVDAPGLGEAASEALSRESDPQAAAPLLRLVARYPSESAWRDAAAWLDPAGRAFAPAADALLAIAMIPGVALDPDLARRVHEVLSSLPEPGHTPTTVALLARVGSPGEVAPLLRSPRTEIAVAAAGALSQWEGGTDELVSTAKQSAALFDPAVLSLMRFRPTADGFAAASVLPAPTPDRRSARLAQYAAALPPRELLRVCDLEPSASVRAVWASCAGRADYFDADDDRQARIELAKVLARSRLAMKDPSEALAGLDAACPPPRDCDWARPIRVTALAWLNRLDEAEAVTREQGVDAAPWLEALASAVELVHAPRVAVLVRELFSGKLTPEDQARLDQLETRARQNQTGPPPPDVGIEQGPPRSAPAPGEPRASSAKQ